MADTAVALAPMPEWWAKTQFHLFETPQPNGHRVGLDRAVIERGVPKGERDVSIFKLACSLRGHDIEYGEALKVVLAAAAKCSPPFPIAEAELKLKQAWRYPAGKRLRVVFGDALPEFVMPLPDDQVLPFPAFVLSKPLRDLVDCGARAIGCPPDFIGVAMLAALASAIGSSRVLQIKRSWRVGARIFAAIVADPGSKKSPALDLAIEPIMRAQARAAADRKREDEEYQQKAAAYETELAIWSQAKKDAARRTGLPVPEQPTKPKEPTERNYMTTNTTLESVAVMLSEWERGIGVFHDELTAWAKSMNMYRAGGKGDDRQQWLKFWSGAATRVTRKGQKPIFLPSPFVCVCGCMPPEVLEDLNDERGRQDGFIHRLLFTMPDTNDDEDDSDIPEAVLEQYDQVFQEIWRLLQMNVDENGSLVPVTVTFTAEGRAFWDRWKADHKAEIKAEYFPIQLRGPWSKLESYCARLALILQECRFICGEIDGENVDEISVAGAAELVDYFKSHARRLYEHLNSTPDDRRAMAVLHWIEKQGGAASERDILRYRVGGIKKKTEVEKIAKDLQDRYFGVRKKIGKSWMFIAGKLAEEEIEE